MLWKMSSSLHRGFVRGTWSEEFYIEDSKRHKMESSGNTSFLVYGFIRRT
jgi:hypothetical protein